MSAPTNPGERLVVGLVRGLHGLKGAVRVEVLTDHAEERFAPGSVVHLEGSPAPLTVAEAGEDRPGWLVRFREVPGRDAAERLRGRYLEVDVASGDGPAAGTFYWHEVVGTTVRDRAGADLGQVVDVYRAGGVDAYVVRGPAHGEWDLPAVRDFIVEFDPRAGTIVVDAERLELGPPPPPRKARPPRAVKAPRALRGPRSASRGGGASGAAARPSEAPPAGGPATDPATDPA